jgi:methoxymalonate biosynthesis acyl carrier protein
VEIRSKLRAFILGHVREADLEDTDDIFAQGFVTSMFALELVSFVETTFGIAVDNEDLDLNNFASIDALNGFVERKLGRRPAGALRPDGESRVETGR